MQERPIRLARRRHYVEHRRGRWRLPLLVLAAVGAILAGSAWGNVQPLDSGPGPRNPEPALQPGPAFASLPLENTTTVAAPPQPVISGAPAVLRQISAESSAPWVKNHRETELRAGPSTAAVAFNTLPQWSTLKVVEARGDWLAVVYEGDGGSRQPGPGWVVGSDVGKVGAPSIWLASTHATPVWTAATGSVQARSAIAPNVRLELLDTSALGGPRVRVRSPGDGQQTAPFEGWVEATDARLASRPASWGLPWAYPAMLRADVRLGVPYRTQLDGSDYASANCGPTALGMALQFFGTSVQPRILRSDVLAAQNDSPDDYDAGTFIWALAAVAENQGVHANGLHAGDGGYHRWTAEDVRRESKAGRPVILQVYYRALPRRGDSQYYGDHYIVVTGLLGDQFLYSDPIEGASEDEGPGWDRVMTGAQLERAMQASDRPYAHTGFSLSR